SARVGSSLWSTVWRGAASGSYRFSAPPCGRSAVCVGRSNNDSDTGLEGLIASTGPSPTCSNSPDPGDLPEPGPPRPSPAGRSSPKRSAVRNPGETRTPPRTSHPPPGTATSATPPAIRVTRAPVAPSRAPAPAPPATGMKNVPTFSADSTPVDTPSSRHRCHPSPPCCAAAKSYPTRLDQPDTAVSPRSINHSLPGIGTPAAARCGVRVNSTSVEPRKSPSPPHACPALSQPRVPSSVLYPISIAPPEYMP